MEHRLLTALKGFIEDGAVARTISRVVDDRQELERWREAAYFHANGFLKCPLWIESETGRKLVMHVWPESSGHWSAEHIHDHRWDFASVLLRGGYRYELFDVAPGGELEVDLHEYRSLGSSVEYSLTRSAPSRLTLVAAGHWVASAGYALERSVLHRLSRVRSGTVTLVLQGAAEVESTRVALTGTDSSSSQTVVVRRPTLDELRSDLVQVQGLLA